MKEIYTFSASSVVLGIFLAQFLSLNISAQTNLPPKRVAPSYENTAASTLKVTQIDELGLSKLLQPRGKPLLINFWATWCDPCREEFPDLVKINAEYSGKIDFITISLDDLAEINRDVPKFLVEMKAEMPAYLLKTIEENDAISSVSKDWKGGLPFTILYDEKLGAVYTRQGKVKLDELRAKLNLLLRTTPVVPEAKP